MIPMGAIMSGVQGIAGIAGGLIGGGKRKREQREAQAAFDRRQQQFENLDTSNLYTNLDNVYEDLTVNQQQAEFTNRAQQQAMANTMSGMQGAAGGSGIAALAQAMANQASQNAERAGISIGQQERSNQAAQMQQAAQNQLLEIQGEGQSRAAELNKVSTLMGMAGQRLGAANEARAAGTQALLGGVGNILGGAGQALPELLR
jgi:hypothetical protein